MRDEILRVLTMKDILDKYNIKTNRQMFHCPFHKDNNASAKFYDNTFYCFSCNRTGDLIQFVEYLFKLDFKEAMAKINIDFGLNISNNYKVDYKKIKELEYQRQLEKLKKQKEQEKFIKVCKSSDVFKRLIVKLTNEINYQNWEEKTAVISYLQDRLGIIDLYLYDKYKI